MLVYNNLFERICQRFFVFMHHSIYYFLLAPRKTDFWNFNSFLTLVCFLLINNLRKRSVMEEKERKTSAPKINTKLRHNILEMPPCIRNASGIVIYGRRIKSIVFTTDLAIIRNCDADAVFAVYPFTPQQVISDAIIKASYIPVFCGVGGGRQKD